MNWSERIFEYEDYRTFLVDVYAYKKANNPGFSYTLWARKLGVRSGSTLHMILGGKRHPSLNLGVCLAEHLELTPESRSYLLDLIQLQKIHSRDVREAVIVMDRLARQRPRGKFRHLSHEKFLAISSWYYYAILEMVRLKDFQEDPAWIKSRLHFPVSEAKIAKAIPTLLDLGLLARGPGGRLVQTQNSLDTQADVRDLGLQRFHAQMLDNAKQSLRTVSPQKREIYGTTFPMSSARIKQAKKMIRRFHQRFCTELEHEDGQAIYHLEVGFFPLTRLATLLLALLVGCSNPTLPELPSSPNATDRVSATPPGALEGSSAGNGGEDDPTAGVALFLGDRDVNACFEMAPSFGLEPEKAHEVVAAALQAWHDYLRTKKVNDARIHPQRPQGAPQLVFRWQLAHGCEGGEDLTFYLGNLNTPVLNNLRRVFRSQSAFFWRDWYDPAQGWGRGIIWISGSDRLWGPYHRDREQLAEVWLHSHTLHEIGHALGTGHVPGTIMASDIGAVTRQLLLGGLEVNQIRHLLSIDQESQLLTCAVCPFREDPLRLIAEHAPYLQLFLLSAVSGKSVLPSPGALVKAAFEVTKPDYSSNFELQRKNGALPALPVRILKQEVVSTGDVPVFRFHFQGERPIQGESFSTAVRLEGEFDDESGRKRRLHLTINPLGESNLPGITGKFVPATDTAPEWRPFRVFPLYER